MRISIGFQGYLPELRGFRHADKVTHAIYGGIIGGIAAVLAAMVGLPVHGVAIAASAVAGVAKEVYDEKVEAGRWDKWDILATMALPLLALLSK